MRRWPPGPNASCSTRVPICSRRSMNSTRCLAGWRRTSTRRRLSCVASGVGELGLARARFRADEGGPDHDSWQREPDLPADDVRSGAPDIDMSTQGLVVADPDSHLGRWRVSLHMDGRDPDYAARPVALPADSAVAPLYKGADLADAFAVTLGKAHDGDIRVLAQSILGDPAPWVRMLLALRDAAVAGFGVRTSGEMRRAAAKDRGGHIDF